MRKLFLLAVTSVFAMSAAQAMAGEATAQGKAKATIVNDVQIKAVNGEDLDFGTIIATANLNKITVKASDGTRVASVPNSLSPVRESKAGKFTISGSPNVVVTLNAITPINLAGPGTDMPVTNLSYSTDTVTLDDQGAGEFTVGGVLTVNPAQAVGDYEGEYTVTASY